MNYVGALNEDKELINGKKNILIYGASGYGEKIYRNLRAYSRDNAVKAFVDDKKDIKFDQDTVHSIPIMNIEEATEKYKDYILCISEDIVWRVLYTKKTNRRISFFGLFFWNRRRFVI